MDYGARRTLQNNKYDINVSTQIVAHISVLFSVIQSHPMLCSLVSSLPLGETAGEPGIFVENVTRGSRGQDLILLKS